MKNLRQPKTKAKAIERPYLARKAMLIYLMAMLGVAFYFQIISFFK